MYIFLNKNDIINIGDDMEPLKYFEEFLSIPRESGNEKRICDYLIQFAKKNNLEYYVDDISNVIIKRKSNNNSNETIILQGHTDMVCTSINDYDFSSKGIDWYIEDGYYKAKGTTLGADNGIGCSIILALLSNNDIKTPNIEAIFTVQEETTMMGAKRLDYSKITGNKLISIDGTDEGVIEVSSAGMASINVSKKLHYDDNKYETYKITINGLLGGHSGTDIDKNRGNAIKIMFDILSNIEDFDLVDIYGGSKENVIPSECVCIIATNKGINVDNYYKTKYPTMNINVENIEKCAKVIKKDESNAIINFIHNLPIEVVSYHDTFPQTSINLGVIDTNNEHLSISISIRSSNIEEEIKYINIVENLCNGLDFKLLDKKPFFTFKEDSSLRDKLVEKYEQLYNKKIELRSVHAGLEGGVFSENIKDLDVCVIAPNLYDIHTINERVEIESVNRVYRWLIEVLKDL